ncbi:hypothetical protein BDZ94DRAFT_1298689 [Collybia nuda]|uniref:F-box domain-containing protein n=1 Tax=Collybia nuda TaxID=64659 RepID=A0A9P6CIV2_9AGAR|nr:hypothetical protein BDZ94DRAFT_1298689 [Collybia nuda]
MSRGTIRDSRDGSGYLISPNLCLGTNTTHVDNNDEGNPNMIVSPFVNVTSEVLTKIFVDCNDPPVVHLPPGPNFYPWALGHVCSRWRKTLWNSPEVWRNIEIRGDLSRHDTYNGDVLNEILTHINGSVFLSVRYYDTSGVSDVVLSFIHRFKSIELYFISPESLSTLLEMSRGPLTHLESLDVTLGGLFPESLRVPSGFKNICGHLPSFQELRINGFASPPHFPTSHLHS